MTSQISYNKKGHHEFQAHVINIRRLNESCTNESDVIIKALDVYRRMHETKGMEKKHNFGFMRPSISI